MPLRVGWVDDTALIRQLAIRIVERSGHTCRSFPRHVDLLDADREEPFDVIVLQPEDVVSPRLTRRRLLARCPRRAVALASGHPVDRLRDVLGADPAAFDRFLAKPFDPRGIVAWLDEVDTAAARAHALRPVMAETTHTHRAYARRWSALEVGAGG